MASHSETMSKHVQNSLSSSRDRRQTANKLYMSHSLCLILTAACLATTSVHAFSTSNNKHSQFGIFPSRVMSRPSSYQNIAFLSPNQINIPMHISFRTLLNVKASTDEEKMKRKSSKADEEEWNALLSAFKMYKAAYGDLKVPSRFVVPSMPPWPESGWGLKLGQRVAAIRSTGRYVEGDDERRKVLDDMGFLWRLRAPSPDKNMDVSFDQIYDALKTYKKVEGNLNVPSNFIVPNYDPWPEPTRGMPLGKKIPGIRSKAFLKANPQASAKLEKLGFECDGKVAANDARFNTVYLALVRYKELNGDLLVPQPFIVPEGDNDWDEELWGLRLGARVNAIRSQGTFVKSNESRKQLLDDLGFEWELASEGKKRGRKKKTENEALSGPAPPGLFEDVDKDSDDSSSYSESMFQIGDDENAPSWGFEDEEAEQKAVLQQQAAEEEFLPPKNLNSTLEEAAKMAMSVGVIESLGQGKRVTKGTIQKNIPWFNDDFGDEFVFEDVVEALSIYKDIHGDFDNIDIDFVVPEPSIGANFDIDASAAAAAAIAKAESMGEDSDELIAAEIERMEAEMKGDNNRDVDNSKWPEHLAGMKLGSITDRIRDGSLEVKHLPERKQQLDAMGFDWGNPKKFIDVPFEKAMCAMFAYYLIRGDLFVYEDFVMPDGKPWPTSLAGFELGKTVKRIRELQNFFEAYHPEKVRLLRRVEFVWFPDLALPLNPEEGPESWEDTFVEGVGHPFYQVNDPSVATIERLHAEGPFDDSDSTSSYYDYNEVSQFWEQGDITDTGKDSERPNWRPAEWLWFNGFNQLSAEHEERYGVSAGLEMVRLIEQYHKGEISEKEFDTRGKAAIVRWEEEQLRSEAISAGIQVTSDDNMESIIEKIKNDPDCQALDSDPEYLRLLEAEIDAEEARERELAAFGMEDDISDQFSAEVEEEDFDDDFEDEDSISYDSDDDDDDVDFEDDEDDDYELAEEDDNDDSFGIDEEEI